MPIRNHLKLPDSFSFVPTKFTSGADLHLHLPEIRSALQALSLCSPQTTVHSTKSQDRASASAKKFVHVLLKVHMHYLP